MTSALVPEPTERCAVPRSAGSVVVCELAHGHGPDIPGEARVHRGRDKGGHWHDWPSQ